MKIIINKKAFEKHLNQISRALSQHPILYALKGIYLKATVDQLELIASDGNLSIKETIPQDANLKITEPGECLVMGAIFKNIIKKQNGTITITQQNNNILIKTSDSEVTMNLLNLDEYPRIDFGLEGQSIKLKSQQFKALIKDVAFAASENDKRIVLNGVNLKKEAGNLVVSATNSFRIAMGTMPVTSEKDFNITVIAKNLKEFLPESAKATIELNVSENKINLTTANTIIQSKLIDSVYPELERLMPQEYQSTLKIKSAKLNDLVEKAIVLDSGAIVTIKMEINQELCTLESKKEQLGNSHVETTQFSYDGEPFQISFDAGFFKDALKTLSDEIEISFVGDLKPIIIKSKSKPQLIHLILPHRTY